MSTRRLLRVRAYVGRCSAPSSIYTCPGAPAGHRPCAGAFGTADGKLVARLGQPNPQRRAQCNNCARRGRRELCGADLGPLANHRDDLLLSPFSISKRDGESATLMNLEGHEPGSRGPHWRFFRRGSSGPREMSNRYRGMTVASFTTLGDPSPTPLHSHFSIVTKILVIEIVL